MTLQNLDNPFTKLKFRYLVLHFILLSLIVDFSVKILQANSNVKLNQQDLVLTIYIIQFVLLCLWSLKDFQRLRVKLKYVIGDLPKNQNWLRLVGLVLLTMMFSVGASLVLFGLLSLVAPSFVEQVLRDVASSPSVDRYNSFESNVLASFTMVIIAPITEEFIFRGVILQRWATKWGIRAGLLSSSLLFGCLHPHNPIGLSLFGIVLGLFYIKTRSLIVPAACHALNNLLVVSIQLLNHNSVTYTPAEQLQYLRYSWLFGIVLVAISLIFLSRFLWSKWPYKDTVIPYLRNAKKEKVRALST